MTIELMNVIGKYGVNFGHPGLAYNVIDENNFDFVYFRFVAYRRPGKPGVFPRLIIQDMIFVIDLLCDLSTNLGTL